MKISAVIVSIFAFSISWAQKLSSNTLDINYTASYKTAFTFRMSSRLSESQNWALKGFTGGGAYSVGGLRKFSLTYDFWRGNEFNAPISKRYGLTFSTQNKFTNLNISMNQTDSPNTPGGFTGRIDLNMKFK